MMGIGCTRGVASPCCFFKAGHDLSIVVHGDDFTCLGEHLDLNWYETALAKFFELKLRAHIGPEEKTTRRFGSSTESPGMLMAPVYCMRPILDTWRA